MLVGEQRGQVGHAAAHDSEVQFDNASFVSRWSLQERLEKYLRYNTHRRPRPCRIGRLVILSTVIETDDAHYTSTVKSLRVSGIHHVLKAHTYEKPNANTAYTPIFFFFGIWSFQTAERGKTNR